MDSQYTMDLTLDSDRATKDNTAKLITLVYNQQAETAEHIKNKHEAYGIASEAYQVLKNEAATVKGEMDTFLKTLPSYETDTIQIAGTIYAAAQKTAIAAIELAAKCQAIMKDLYYVEPTPIEKALTQSEDEGFETVENEENQEENDNE